MHVAAAQREVGREGRPDADALAHAAGHTVHGGVGEAQLGDHGLGSGTARGRHRCRRRSSVSRMARCGWSTCRPALQTPNGAASRGKAGDRMPGARPPRMESSVDLLSLPDGAHTDGAGAYAEVVRLGRRHRRGRRRSEAGASGRVLGVGRHWWLDFPVPGRRTLSVLKFPSPRRPRMPCSTSLR